MNRTYFDYLVEKDDLNKEHNAHSSNITYCIHTTETSSTLTESCKCAYLYPVDSARFVL